MNVPRTTPVMISRFEEAFVYAARLYARELRKRTDVPYLSHLLSVAGLVVEDGASKDEAIAALLHDAVEDQGGSATLHKICQRFGSGVAAIVNGCTDTDISPKPPWFERKERYLAHLRETSTNIRRVSVADKLHNARAILADYRRMGSPLWARFTGGRDGTIWYYRSLAEVFLDTCSGPMAVELDRVVAEIERIAKTRPHYSTSGASTSEESPIS